MLKTTVLACAVLLTLSASAFGIHLSGWLTPSDTSDGQIAHTCADDGSLPNDAAMRYRQNQNLNWRCAMTLRQ